MKSIPGVLSACPRSLGLAAASDLFAESQLTSLLQDAKTDIGHYATVFSNGNKNLAKGIQAQHEIALRIWEENKIAPVEMNLGMEEEPVICSFITTQFLTSVFLQNLVILDLPRSPTGPRTRSTPR